MHRKLMLLFVVAVATCVGGSAADTPHIVKRFHLYNQLGAIGPVTVYTPRAGHGGMFRVNTVMVLTVGNGGSAHFCGDLGFTTRLGPSEWIATFSCLATTSAGRIDSLTVPIPDLGGYPLTFSISTDGDVSGAKCDVDIVVEEL
jgi:hypothetical protein